MDSLRALLTSAFYSAATRYGTRSSTVAEKWLELSSLHRFLVAQKITTVLDVGANEGQFASKLRRMGFGGRIISFEPDPRAFQKLIVNMKGDSDWSGQPLALGNESSEADLHFGRDSFLSSLLSIPADKSYHQVARVEVRKLDELIDSLVPSEDESVLLKTDTQGYDLNVLSGAANCLNRFRGILAELSVIPMYTGAPTLPNALEAYQDAGFDLVSLGVAGRTMDGRILELDGLFIRRSD